MKTSVDIYRAFLQLKNISSEIFCYIDFEKSILTAYSMRSVLIGFEYPCGTLRIIFAQNPIRRPAPGSS